MENCLREDLKPIEQARAFRALIDRRGWSTASSPRRSTSRRRRSPGRWRCSTCPTTVRSGRAGELAPSVAYEVSKLEDPDAQREVADRVVGRGPQPGRGRRGGPPGRRAAGQGEGQGGEQGPQGDRRASSRPPATRSPSRMPTRDRRRGDAGRAPRGRRADSRPSCPPATRPRREGEGGRTGDTGSSGGPSTPPIRGADLARIEGHSPSRARPLARARRLALVLARDPGDACGPRDAGRRGLLGGGPPAAAPGDRAA